MGRLMSTGRCSQVFLSFFAKEQRQWFDKGSNCIFSIARIAIQTIHRRKSLCSHNGLRGLLRQSTGTAHRLCCFNLLSHSLSSDRAVFTNHSQCPSLFRLAKKQHTLSAAGQASESTAHYENIISTSEQIIKVLYKVSHQHQTGSCTRCPCMCASDI